MSMNSSEKNKTGRMKRMDTTSDTGGDDISTLDDLSDSIGCLGRIAKIVWWIVSLPFRIVIYIVKAIAETTEEVIGSRVGKRFRFLPTLAMTCHGI